MEKQQKEAAIDNIKELLDMKGGDSSLESRQNQVSFFNRVQNQRSRVSTSQHGRSDHQYRLHQVYDNQQSSHDLTTSMQPAGNRHHHHFNPLLTEDNLMQQLMSPGYITGTGTGTDPTKSLSLTAADVHAAYPQQQVHLERVDSRMTSYLERTGGGISSAKSSQDALNDLGAGGSSSLQGTTGPP